MGLLYRRQPVKARAVDQKASRAFDTDYQNTTGRPLLIIVNAKCYRGTGAASSWIQGKIDDETPIVHVVGQAGLDTMTDVPENIDVFLVFMVPNNWYYRVNDMSAGVGSLNTLLQWWEVEL